MADVLAPIITILAIGLFVGSWVVYLRRVRQGRADPVVDPSWPSDLRRFPRQLHDTTGSLDSTPSLYLDPNESGQKRGPELPSHP